MGLKARVWLLGGALMLSAWVLAGCGSSGETAQSDDGVAATEDEPTPIVDPDTTGSGDGDEAPPAESSNEEQQATQVEELQPAEDDGSNPIVQGLRPATEPFGTDVTYDPSAVPSLLWFTAFDPGVYRTGALGTPLSFTATETLSTQFNGSGTFVLSDVRSSNPDEYELFFMRISNFSDPTAPNTPIADQQPWPADDFRGWLENLDDIVIASDPIETSISGLPAVTVDLELSDDAECGWEPGFCVGLAENNGAQIKALNRGARYRVWVVEQAEEDPMLVVAAIASDDQASWLPRADALLDTVAFGDIAPNPVRVISPGPTALDALGGIEVDLPDNLTQLTAEPAQFVSPWNGRQFAFVPVMDLFAGVSFVDRPHDVEGNPLDTPDDVVAELTANGGTVVEIESTTVGGVEARVFDFETDDPFAIMLRYSPLDLVEPLFGWDAPAAGRIWLIEHPDRGLQMISADAFEDLDVALPRVHELGDAIVQGLSFTG